ncbi:MAG: hypothetical protein M1840_002554 [Geoglossum simile]|nr:MAG: hypothetical protein M1840_002554 [Geoglossum simile]
MIDLFTILVIVVTHAQVAGSAWLPDGFQRWFWQSSVIVGDWLYIDGGEIYTSQKKGSSPLNKTFAIPLSASWTSSSVEAVVNDKPTGLDYSRKPAVWYDPVDGSVFSWGGFTYSNANSKTMWAFRPDGRGGAVWEQRYSSNSSFWTHFTSPGGSLAATTPLGFYSLGGALIKNNSPNFAMPGLVVYDFREKTWSNLSAAAYASCGCAVLGQAQFVPRFGQDGLLTMLGGDSPDDHIYKTGGSIKDLSNVTVYDIHNQMWYYQTATGDVPPPREQFCMVSALGTDNSTYEIFLYGGISTSAQGKVADPEYAQVYILSLPAFTWIRAPNSTVQRLFGHSCQVIGRRQMIVIGGSNPQSGEARNIWPNGLGVFDMTSLQWTSGYDAEAKSYIQPDIVKKYYDQNTRYPATWDVPALATVFGAPLVKTSPTATVPPFGASKRPPSQSAAAAKGRRKLNVGAIAGGVAGGVIGLLLLLALGKYFLYRRQHKLPPVFELGASDPRELGAYRLSGQPVMKQERTNNPPYQSQSLKPRVNLSEEERDSVGHTPTVCLCDKYL